MSAKVQSPSTVIPRQMNALSQEIQGTAYQWAGAALVALGIIAGITVAATVNPQTLGGRIAVGLTSAASGLTIIAGGYLFNKGRELRSKAAEELGNKLEAMFTKGK